MPLSALVAPIASASVVKVFLFALWRRLFTRLPTPTLLGKATA